MAAPILGLRPWLDHLAATDRLAVAKPGLGLRHEIAALAKHLEGKRAVFCPAPDGHDIPVVSGLLGARSWMEEALGVAPRDLPARFAAACADPLPWQETGAAAVQDIVQRPADLGSLPIPTHNEHDSGPYITAGLLICRNPRTGIQNVSIHRLQVNGPDELGALLLPRHTLASFEAAEAEGGPLEVAIVIGVDPICLLASQAIVPLDHDELAIAGRLRGAPLPVAKCRTSDIRVPADAEIVLEGRILPGARAPEGPFGEFPQYYGERAPRHVIKLDAITRRRDAIFHTILGGGLEHILLGAIPREASILGFLRSAFIGVRDVHLSMGGVGRYVLYVQFRKRRNGEAKNVILGAFAAHYDIKQVIVVDEDVDIHDPREVEWAVATRAQADRDFVIVSGTQGSKLDPSTDDGVGAKWGVDATIPLDAPAMKYTRIRVPGEDRADLDLLLQPDLKDWRLRNAPR
jgi:2,5-furandicarboxylate decarboxylase 1